MPRTHTSLPTLPTRSILGLAGVVVSLVCFWLAFRDVPLDDLLHALAGANYWWLVPSIGAQLIGSLARARRWQLLLLNRASFADLFWALMIGLLGNNVLPFRAGEAARVVVVNQRTGVPLAQVAGSVMLERALDVATILGLLVLLLPLMPVPPFVLTFAAALGATLALVAVVLFAVLRSPRRSDAILLSLAAHLPGQFDQLIVRRWQELLAGFATLRDGRMAAQVVLWSVIAWVGSIGLCWTLIEAVAPGGSWVEAAFTTVAISLGISMPSTPGYLGVFQLVAQQALLIAFPDRYTASSALSVALLIHASYWLFSSTLGAVGLARLGLSLTRVRHAAQSP